MIRSFDSNQNATLLKSLDSFCWSSLRSFAEVNMTISLTYSDLKYYQHHRNSKEKVRGLKLTPVRHHTIQDQVLITHLKNLLGVFDQKGS